MVEFEDRFDHEPGATYEDDEDLLDYDEEESFAPKKKAKKKGGKKDKKKKKKSFGGSPLGGVFWSLFKSLISIGLVVFTYFYIFQPERLSNIKAYVGIRSTKPVETMPKKPILPFEKTDDFGKEAPIRPQASITPTAPIQQPTQKQPEAQPKPRPKPEEPKMILTSLSIDIPGKGSLPDLKTAVARNDELADYLSRVDRINFDSLYLFKGYTQRLIYRWAEVNDLPTTEAKQAAVAEKVGIPFNDFENEISIALLPQTVLPKAGITPIYNTKGKFAPEGIMIKEDPVMAMASVYPLLNSSLDIKTDTKMKLKTVEPVSTFLIHICNDSIECLASWDLLIDMLGLKQYSEILEKTPEKIDTL